MKVNKFIKSKISKNFFFIKGKLDINCKYFISEVEKGIKREDNKNFKTNLMSEMTSYKFFMNDKKFYEIIFSICDLIDENDFNEGDPWQLNEVWGYKHTFGNYTKYHHHLPSIMSGAIMLNKHSQKLYFPEIKEELKSEPGNFALFSSFLKHGNERTKSNKPRYGLSFNFMYGK
jgi:hypothetical protein